MALFPRPLLVDGATHPAQQFRMMIRDLTGGSEGVTEGDDLKVTALATPGSSVQIAPGSGTIRGRANVYQGSYTACNLATDTVPIAATGASARSDMVVLRVLDPEYEGSLNPATDNINYFEVISGVSSSATTVPGGRTAIPLARITIPANTSIITNSYITDLRKITRPRRERNLVIQSPPSISGLLGGSTTYSYFSTAGGWNIAVPNWATTVRIKIDVSPLRFSANDFFGSVRATFGSSLTLQPTLVDDNQGTVTRRVGTVIADTLTLPADYRGTTQLLRVQGAGASGNLGRISVDSGTALAADIQFEEAPR
ncbi:hypothetical protein [Streptomyces sp. Wb2n-11]|uniref:hypothetical protein n=1 Tax=Streptomyces sp. Wb2n-11 TaxID=1030533 RepID=UPI000AFC17B0|nr:hypothetical protein [Streptomyces sp. Wb2n-11]